MVAGSRWTKSKMPCWALGGETAEIRQSIKVGLDEAGVHRVDTEDDDTAGGGSLAGTSSETDQRGKEGNSVEMEQIPW